MSKEEIADFAREMVESGRYPRTVESLRFILNRMHIVLHGVAPEGETQSRADVMFRDTQPIINYVLSRGDLDEEDIQSYKEMFEGCDDMFWKVYTEKEMEEYK